MPSAAGKAPIVRVDADFQLLIPSRFPPIALFERIADEAEAAVVAEIEGLTNPRLRERQRAAGVGAGDVTSPMFQNWNHAPFAYRNPLGSRHFGPEVSVLEMAEDLETALAVSVRRREAFLGSTGEARTDLDMRVLTRRVTGGFGDFRAFPADADRDALLSAGRSVLAADPPLDGMLYRPPERSQSTCVAVLERSVLGRAVQGEHFRFVWDGRRIRSIYSFSDGRLIDPALLGIRHEVGPSAWPAVAR